MDKEPAGSIPGQEGLIRKIKSVIDYLKIDRLASGIRMK